MTTMERPTLPRRAVLALGAGAGLASATGAWARAHLVDLAVVDRETGQPMQVWRHNGRLFVAGRPGGRYGLRVANNTAGRVLAVMSVDGVNIVTGQTAAFDQRGYVFEPYQHYDINGWRKSDAQVAAFAFASAHRSYAARTGRPDDVGVIGLAVFRERYVPPPPPPIAESRARPGAADSSAEVEELVTQGRRAEAPSRLAPPQREERLGTAHGAREWSSARQVTFERASSRPDQIARIEYDTYGNLVAAGVIRPPSDPGRRPRPFPNSGYVPDPPGGF